MFFFGQSIDNTSSMSSPLHLPNDKTKPTMLSWSTDFFYLRNVFSLSNWFQMKSVVYVIEIELLSGICLGWRRRMTSCNAHEWLNNRWKEISPGRSEAKLVREDFINVENSHGWRQWLTGERRNVKSQSPTRFQQRLRSATLSSPIVTFRANEPRKVSPKAREDDFCKLCRIFDCFYRCWVRVCSANWIFGLFVSLFLVFFLSV